VILPDNILPIVQKAISEFTRYPKLQRELRNLEEPVHILAIGKAAYQMALVAYRTLDPNQMQSCIILTKYGFYPPQIQPDFKPVILEAGHPIPDENSILHSCYILDWLKTIPTDESLVVLLSGGCSALFEIPREPHTLKEIIALNRVLLKSGLDIHQINQQRKIYSLVKAGAAIEYFNGKQIKVFVLSDVKGDDPAIIGSGPFYQKHISHCVIGNNQALLRQIASLLHRHRDFADLPIKVAHHFVDDDVRRFAHALAHYSQTAPKGIYIFGGECSIRPRGTGSGGRLSQLALEFALKISGMRKIQLIALASDGNDNVPESAGAIVNQDSKQKILDAGIDPEKACQEYNSFPALVKAGLIIDRYYTGCNVNDIMLLFIEE